MNPVSSLSHRWIYLVTAALICAATGARAQSLPACTGELYSPAMGTHGLVLFEDEWPENGDLDFNDQTISYSIEMATSGADQVVALNATFNVLAIGAELTNGLYFHLPGVHASDLASAILVDSAGGSANATLISGETEAVFELTSDTRLLFFAQDQFINTSPAIATQAATKAVELQLVFNRPISLDTSSAPFDLFIAHSDNYDFQIHRPAYSATALAYPYNQAHLYTSGDDGSNRGFNTGRWYVNSSGLPFALTIPEQIEWPQERVAIDQIYKDLIGFATSAGVTNTNWYTPQANIDPARLFTAGAGGSTPPSPIFVTSGDPYASCLAPFVETGALHFGRLNAASANLPDGRVLIAGGADSSNNVLDSAELYDPVTGAFTETGSLRTGRSQSSAVALGNGKILFVGGVDSGNSSLASAELYDPSSGSFSYTGNSLSQAVDGATVTLLQDGKVLVAGGHVSAINDGTAMTALYDPTANMFAATGRLQQSREDNPKGSALLQDGTVLVFGGYGRKTGEIYDPVAGSFTLLSAPLVAGCLRLTTTALPDGQVLITGGLDVTTTFYESAAQLYDPSTQTFTLTGSMAAARADQTATLLNDGTVLVAGGYSSGGARSDGELYSPETGEFTPAGMMAEGHTTATANLLSNGQVLIAGGSSANTNAGAAAELYRPGY